MDALSSYVLQWIPYLQAPNYKYNYMSAGGWHAVDGLGHAQPAPKWAADAVPGG